MGSFFNSLLVQLAEWAMAAKRLSFENAAPPNDLVAALRQLAAELTAHAPAYLRPPAQELLLVTPADCLAVIERAVHWEAEKLYGVEGAGPFDEFCGRYLHRSAALPRPHGRTGLQSARPSYIRQEAAYEAACPKPFRVVAPARARLEKAQGV